jgi:archaellum biogenesis protein FlaJ (TadC family)
MGRILVIHSTSDSNVDDRIVRMAAKPELTAYEFKHIYFFLPEYAQEIEKSSKIRPGEFLDQYQSRILQRMTQQIEFTQPEMIVLHTGIAFTMAPIAVLNILSGLKSRFPQLKFAIQEGKVLEGTLSAEGPRFADQVRQIFDRSPETQDILKHMF